MTDKPTVGSLWYTPVDEDAIKEENQIKCKLCDRTGFDIYISVQTENFIIVCRNCNARTDIGVS